MTTFPLPLCQPGPTPPGVDDVAGFGELRAPTGELPLCGLDVGIRVVGLDAVTDVRQRFSNATSTPLEVTYIFPLPGRAAVTSFDAVLGATRVTGCLRERQVARDLYDAALAEGRRAGILEEDRPEVFTVRIGNLGPGEDASIHLRLVQRLAVDDGEATVRFPLVVAPRYVPGAPLDGPPAGDGTAADTDAAPDASRVTPPRLLAGCPQLADLSISLSLDPAGLSCSDLRSTLHAVTEHPSGTDAELLGPVSIRLAQREAIDRDFIVRFRVRNAATPTAVMVADPPGRADLVALGGTSTLLVTLLPPRAERAEAACDVVLVLDRSGSMAGWKMVAARRAAARIVDTLGPDDRFAAIAFDTAMDWFAPAVTAGHRLVSATDALRYRAVEWLARIDARGGTDLDEALRQALATAEDGGRQTAVVVITDGHVADEDRLVRTAQGAGGRVRIHGVGIDRAVNGAALDRIAASGHWDVVESEARLDEVLRRVQRRIRTPALRDVRLAPAPGHTLRIVPGTQTPPGALDAYPGVPLTIAVRCEGSGPVTLAADDPLGTALTWTLPSSASEVSELLAAWGRGRIRDLEDAYAAHGDEALPAQIVSASLATSVLSRHTAFVAIDHRGEPLAAPAVRTVQPVAAPSGWVAAGAAYRVRPTAVLSSYSAVPARAPIVPGGRVPPRPVIRRPDDHHEDLKDLAEAALRIKTKAARSSRARQLADQLTTLLADWRSSGADQPSAAIRDAAAALRAALKNGDIPAIRRAANGVLAALQSDKRAPFWSQRPRPTPGG